MTPEDLILEISPAQAEAEATTHLAEAEVQLHEVRAAVDHRVADHDLVVAEMDTVQITDPQDIAPVEDLLAIVQAIALEDAHHRVEDPQVTAETEDRIVDHLAIDLMAGQIAIARTAGQAADTRGSDRF